MQLLNAEVYDWYKRRVRCPDPIVPPGWTMTRLREGYTMMDGYIERDGDILVAVSPCSTSATQPALTELDRDNPIPDPPLQNGLSRYVVPARLVKHVSGATALRTLLPALHFDDILHNSLMLPSLNSKISFLSNMIRHGSFIFVSSLIIAIIRDLAIVSSRN